MTEEKRKPGYQHWCTPEWILERVREVYRGDIDLDPFSNPYSTTNAKREWWEPGYDWGAFDVLSAMAETDIGRVEVLDGFSTHWRGHVFFNPPFSRTRDAITWAHYLWEQGNIDAAIGIFPCSMNSKHWWMVEAAPAYGYFTRRVAFVDDGEVVEGPRHDIAIAYWGREPTRFVKAFQDKVRFPPGCAALASLVERER